MGLGLLPAAPGSGRNYLDNAHLSVWQAGTSFALASGVETFVADRWKARRGATGSTVSRQAGFSGELYAIRLARNSGQTGTGSVSFSQQLETGPSLELAGKTVVMSCDIRHGANFSGTNFVMWIYTGTGLEESFSLSAFAFTTGPVASGVLQPTGQTISSTVQRLVALPYTIPADVTEVAIQFGTGPLSGTAGAADYVEATNFKLEVGPRATPFEKRDPADELARCLRHFRKSFLQATTPAQNAGAGTGEFRAPITIAGAVAGSMGTVQFNPMRVAPTITLYNPAAANAQVRNLTDAADCTSSAAGNITESGFEITYTGAAAAAVGEVAGVHWAANARL